jgi:hypothetical protein
MGARDLAWIAIAISEGDYSDKPELIMGRGNHRPLKDA